MKKYLYILLFICGCQKPNIIYQVNDTDSKSVKTDTTVSGVWDGNWKVLRIENAIIRGSGELTNWIIAASVWQQIFDSSINIGNIKIYDDGAFSPRWFGAHPSNADNWWYIQKSVNIGVKNNLNVRLPEGNYLSSKSITASTIYKGQYVATHLNFYGDGDIWNNATTITFTGNIGYGFGIQMAKGGSIHNIMLQGNFVSPANNGIPYYNLSDADFKDVSGRSGRNYSGIVIDYDGSKNTGGSTGFKIYDTWVSGFDILYNISPNGVTFNADNIIMSNIRCGDGRIGVQSGQAQEKGNEINFITSWGNLYNLISIGNSGKFQAGSWTIRGGNIAGGNIRIFKVTLSGWNPFSVDGLTAESIASLGTITSGDSRYVPAVSLNDLRIRFALPSQAGKQILFTSNTTQVKLSDCTFWYYGLPGEEMWFSGKMSFDDNCSFSGQVVWK